MTQSSLHRAWAGLALALLLGGCSQFETPASGPAAARSEQGGHHTGSVHGEVTWQTSSALAGAASDLTVALWSAERLLANQPSEDDLADFFCEEPHDPIDAFVRPPHELRRPDSVSFTFDHVPVGRHWLRVSSLAGPVMADHVIDITPGSRHEVLASATPKCITAIVHDAAGNLFGEGWTKSGAAQRAPLRFVLVRGEQALRIHSSDPILDLQAAIGGSGLRFQAFVDAWDTPLERAPRVTIGPWSTTVEPSLQLAPRRDGALAPPAARLPRDRAEKLGHGVFELVDVPGDVTTVLVSAGPWFGVGEVIEAADGNASVQVTFDSRCSAPFGAIRGAVSCSACHVGAPAVRVGI